MFFFFAQTKSSRLRFRLFVSWNVHIIVFLLIFVYLLLFFFWLLSCLWGYYFTSYEIFIPADGLSLEFEWQQISSRPQVSSLYFSRFQWLCSLDCFSPVLWFPSLLAPLSSLSESFWSQELQLISSSPSCSTAFKVLWLGLISFSLVFTQRFLCMAKSIIMRYHYRVLYTSVRFLTFTRVWMIVSLLKSSGVLWVFWLI